MGEPLFFIKACRFAANAFSSICDGWGFMSSSHLVMESWISMTVAVESCSAKKSKSIRRKLKKKITPSLVWSGVRWLERLRWRRAGFNSWRGLSQMTKDDTDWNLLVCKCWNETSKSEGKVLPLLSIDNRYTSCLRRKQQTCGVFGLDLSVAGIEKPTL